MVTQKGLNIPMLKEVCAKDSKFQKVWQLYSDRDRGRTSCTVPRIRRIMKESGTDLSLDEAVAMMKVWQAAGCGRYVSGRRDQDNRFLWTYDIPSLAKRILAVEAPEGVEPAAIGKAPRTRAHLAKVDPQVIPPVSTTRVGTDMPTGEHPGLKVRFAGFEIELPKDMSQSERTEAQAFIANLRART